MLGARREETRGKARPASRPRAIRWLIGVGLWLALSARGTEPKPPVAPFESPAAPAPANGIDERVFARLKRLGIQPANPASDAVFLRRVFLDTLGTLPAAGEASEFLAASSPRKRQELIDRLLAREEFADYWAMKWCDLLRVKSEFPINLWPNAVQAYHRWIRTALAQNLPCDRFVRELLTASGSNFRRPPVNFYRAMQNREPATIAQTVALTFMGVRLEKWPEKDRTALAAFFSRLAFKETGEWKEEIVQFDPAPNHGKSMLPLPRTFPDGTPVQLGPDQDPREAFAAWLCSPRNPWFARNLVNRVWSWLLGRGIVHEPDDFRADNPPRNPELLAWLERELIAARYDLKHLFRLILNSRTYQLSAIPASANPEAAAEFACYPPRRLEAEVLIDALCQITGTTEKYSSAVPEPFSFIPENQRSIALADASTTSAFLEMFGRPPRDTGLESERNNRPTAAQRLHLLNSSHIQRKLEQGPRLRSLIQGGVRSEEAVSRLYLTVLSRFPTTRELAVVREYAGAGDREAAQDLVWALINTPEFLYRH